MNPREMLKHCKKEAQEANKRLAHWHKVNECLGMLKRGWVIYRGNSMVKSSHNASCRWIVGRAVIKTVREVMVNQ